MSTPIVIPNFGASGQPFSLDALNEALAAIVASINALSADPLLQYGVTPGNNSSYLSTIGGSLLGQLTAPSILVGPVGGTQYAVVTLNDLATTAVPGVVKKATLNADQATTALVISAADADATYGQAEADLINELKTDFNALKTEHNNLVNSFNALQAKMRTAGQLSTT